MKTPLLWLIRSYLLAILFLGCKEECLDIPQLDADTEAAIQWKINDAIVNTTFTDVNGINQTLQLIDKTEFVTEDIVEDDCGNSYGSFNYSYQFRTSLSPIFLLIDLRSNPADDDGLFSLEFQSSEINNDNINNPIIYDIIENRIQGGGATSTFKSEFVINGEAYFNVVEIVFRDTNTPTDLKSLHYAKGLGIVQFTQQNGNIHKINN